MKTFRLVLASVLTLAGVAGCTPSDDDAATDTPVVLATFTVIADIAENVAGEHLRVESLTGVGTEIHSYEPTPGDLRRAGGAELVLDNGLGLEAWFDQFIEQSGAQRVVVSEGVEVIDIEGQPGTPNPHAWMSPRNAQRYAANIAEAFADLDPGNASEYHANAAAYGTELEQVHSELQQALADVPAGHRALVTCEGAFSYLARDAGLDEHYLWPVNAEGGATPRRLSDVIAVVQDNAVPAVFCESTVSDAAMQQVVEATDAEFGGVLYVDSLSEPGGPVPTYLDLVRYDVDLIVDGLTGAAP